MIKYKTKEEVKVMIEGGHILAEVVAHVMNAIKPGVTELEIDTLAEKLIRERGGEPGFKRVEGYKHSICMSTNDVVVHGIPGDYAFKEGDVVGVDCGVFYNGFHTDMAETLRVSESKKQDEVDKFLAVGKEALNAGIAAAKLGNRVGHISKTIQDIIEKKNNYSVVRSLIGHGVGQDLHEDPEVPGYLHGSIDRTPILKEGMTIAVEVIYNMGSGEVALDSDGWTIRSEDGKLAGLFERTIAITQSGPVIITA